MVPVSQIQQQIQRLSAHAGISPEQARTALEACGGDLLDALVWLEQQGIIADAGVCTYSTKDGVTAEPPNQTAPEAEPAQEKQNWLVAAWNWLVDNRLEAYRKDSDDRSMECPMAALLALLALAWWVVTLLLVAGFFLGWRYRLVGPNLGRSQMVQDVMEKLDDGAETVVDQVRRNIRPKNPKNGE